MTEIEKIQRYIERTGINTRPTSPYSITWPEAAALAVRTQDSDLPIEVIALVFNYGMAKGYRAAKAEVRA